MNENYIVKKSNYFIMNSSYDLSLEEQKIILTLASMVQPEDEEFKPYKFKIADFIELLGIETQTKYTEIPKITKELMKKVFEIQEGNKLIQTAWLSGAVYEKGTGYVELTFSPYLKPYMLKLNTMFTQYKLANVLSMKSKYSPRVYEFLKCNEFKKQGYIDIEVDELRKLLKSENIYPKYNDFKRYILERAQKELKKMSDISFEFEEIKTGRKVTSIRFYIKSNKTRAIKEPKAIDELSATIEADDTQELQKGIEQVIKIMDEHNVTKDEAMRIYSSAKGDLYQVKEVYEHFKRQQADNFIGLMISMVKPGAFNEPKRNSKKLKFDNFTPREYDYNDLEKKLLGWDKEDHEERQGYLQEKIEI